MKIAARAALAVCLTGLSSLPAFAQAASPAETIAVVAVAEPPGPSAELTELTTQLRSAVAERTPGVLSASQLRERMTGQSATATLGELDGAYAGALVTYKNGDSEGAVRSLHAIVDDLEKLPDSPEAFDQWTRAMMRLARIEQARGRKDEVSSIVDQLVHAAPDVKADANEYPPSFVKQIDDAKAQVKSLPKHRLEAQAAAKGVKVFLDGRSVGVAPLTIAVPSGRYRVSGQLNDVRLPRMQVDLREQDQTVTFDVAVIETFRPGAGPGLAVASNGRAKTLITAGAQLAVDKVIAASFVTRGDARYLDGDLYDVRRGMLLRHAGVRLSNQQPRPGGVTALARFLITGERVTGLEIELEPPKPQPTASKTLGWTALGAGVLSVGLGTFAVVEGLSAKSKYNDANAMLQGNTLKPDASPARYNELVASGDSARNKAYLGAGLAVGTAALGGVLGYLSYKQSGEVGPFRF